MCCQPNTDLYNFPRCGRTNARTEAYFQGAKKYLLYPVEVLAVAQRISNDTPNRVERSKWHLIKRGVWSVDRETRVTSSAVLNISHGKHVRIPGIQQRYYDTILQTVEYGMSVASLFGNISHLPRSTCSWMLATSRNNEILKYQPIST